MIMLEQDARLIATASGGVQKEAFFYRVSCVTMRTETEWVELVELGWNRLCPSDQASHLTDSIAKAIDRRGKEGSPYGDGKAAGKIVQRLGEG